MKICVIYLDDLIIFSNNYKEHLERLDIVFQRLQECNLKLSPGKCFFLQDKVRFLGHIVGAEGIETDPDKIEKVTNWPRPTNPDELRSFLCFCWILQTVCEGLCEGNRAIERIATTYNIKEELKEEMY